MRTPARSTSDLVVVLALALLACGGDDGGGGDGDGTADAGPDADGGPGVDGSPAGCDRTGFFLSSESAERSDDDGIVFYTGVDDSPGEVLTVDFYFGLGATDGPATIEFAGENFATCGTCVLVKTDCDEGICGRRFLAETGTLDVTALGPVGDRFTATLTSATFTEVTIDTNTAESTPVEGGETWCIEGLALDAEIEGV